MQPENTTKYPECIGTITFGTIHSYFPLSVLINSSVLSKLYWYHPKSLHPHSQFTLTKLCALLFVRPTQITTANYQPQTMSNSWNLFILTNIHQQNQENHSCYWSLSYASSWLYRLYIIYISCSLLYSLCFTDLITIFIMWVIWRSL